jgi:hypothetical protein
MKMVELDFLFNAAHLYMLDLYMLDFKKVQ